MRLAIPSRSMLISDGFVLSVHRGAACLVFHLPASCNYASSRLASLFGLVPRLLYHLPISLALFPYERHMLPAFKLLFPYLEA